MQAQSVPRRPVRCPVGSSSNLRVTLFSSGWTVISSIFTWSELLDSVSPVPSPFEWDARRPCCPVTSSSRESASCCSVCASMLMLPTKCTSSLSMLATRLWASADDAAPVADASPAVGPDEDEALISASGGNLAAAAAAAVNSHWRFKCVQRRHGMPPSQRSLTRRHPSQLYSRCASNSRRPSYQLCGPRDKGVLISGEY